ncbi:MAG: hypothetical protein DRO99_04255, partial [Candidatus Aenigmatarchaeota archaeon]
GFLKEKLVVDLLHKKSGETRFIGEVLHGSPKEMQMILDFTGLRGSGSNIYHSFIYRAPKWRYSVKKVDDFLYVSPVWAEFYNITLAQKQKLEQTIKTGLTSAAQAVADFELLSHDARRYKEIIDYFVEAEKTGDEHVLRSLFVDRVDAYTGEGYSMVTMARRWPTIITDFIRMKDGWTDVNTIRKELDVAAAEATVLKTKNMLYQEWKKLFLPVVKERFARIENLANARKKSVDEYKEWLKPYIAKFKAMRELDENPSAWVTDAYVTPGFGQSEAMVGTRLWIWKSISIVEKGKPPARLEYGKAKWEIHPYDDWVKAWKKLIEYKYELRIEDEDVEGVLSAALSKEGTQFEVQQMYPEDLYYILFDIHFILNLLRTPPPEGIESDNFMVMPITTYIMSQNALLLYILELKAKEKAMEHYVNEIIGAKSIEQEVLEEVEKRFKGEEETKSSRKGRLSGVGRKLKVFTYGLIRLFVRPGPYEAVFYERVSKMYFRESGKDYKTIINFFKEKMQIGK